MSGESAAPTRFSPVQSVPHLVVLCVATFGLYLFYWFYRNWQWLNRQGYVRGGAGWRTVVFLLPIVNIVQVYDLFKAIHDAARAKGLPTFSTPGWLTPLSVVLGGLSLVAGFLPVALVITARLAPDIHGIVSAFPMPVGGFFTALASVAPAAVIPAIAQKTLNALWGAEQAPPVERRPFSVVEFVIVTIGGILWWNVLLG